MRIINLTPHEVVLCGQVLPSAGSARCEAVTEQLMTIDGIKVNRKKFGLVTGLPKPQKDTIYIVSRIVAEALHGSRDDVFIVDETVRDESGKIVGANALAVI